MLMEKIKYLLDQQIAYLQNFPYTHLNGFKKEDLIKKTYDIQSNITHNQNYDLNDFLLFAIICNNYNLSKELLNSGADPNVLNNTDKNLQDKLKPSQEILYLLIAKGADIDSSYNSTPSITKSYILSYRKDSRTHQDKDFLNILALIIEKTKILNQEDKQNLLNNMLFNAIELNDHKLFDKLLNLGANVNCENNQGKTPLTYAYDKGRKYLAYRLSQASTIKPDGIEDFIKVSATIQSDRKGSSSFDRVYIKTTDVPIDVTDSQSKYAQLVISDPKDAEDIKIILHQHKDHLSPSHTRLDIILHGYSRNGNHFCTPKSGNSFKTQDLLSFTNPYIQESHVHSCSAGAINIIDNQSNMMIFGHSREEGDLLTGQISASLVLGERYASLLQKEEDHIKNNIKYLLHGLLSESTCNYTMVKGSNRFVLKAPTQAITTPKAISTWLKNQITQAYEAIYGCESKSIKSDVDKIVNNLPKEWLKDFANKMKYSANLNKDFLRTSILPAIKQENHSLAFKINHLLTKDNNNCKTTLAICYKAIKDPLLTTASKKIALQIASHAIEQDPNLLKNNQSKCKKICHNATKLLGDNPDDLALKEKFNKYSNKTSSSRSIGSYLKSVFTSNPFASRGNTL